MSALLALGDVEEEVDGLLIDENAQAVMIDADMRAFLAMEQFEGVVIPIVGGTLPLRVVEMCCASVFGDCSSALARCVKRKLLLARLEACREVVSAAVPEKAAAAEKAESKKAAAAEKAAAKKAAAAEKAAAKKAAAAAKKAAVVGPDPARAPTEPSSRFWGVHWDRRKRKWQAQYRDADGKQHAIGLFADEEEAARAVNKAIRDAGLEGRRKTNAVDATGALVPRVLTIRRDFSAVVAPDAARAPTAMTSSRFWGVTWNKAKRRWRAIYSDANGKLRHIGLFDTQEAAAHAVNAAIRRAGLEGKRRTNPVVDGQLVPRARKANGHGKDALRKRRREESAAATPSQRARRDAEQSTDAAMEC